MKKLVTLGTTEQRDNRAGFSYFDERTKLKFILNADVNAFSK